MAQQKALWLTKAGGEYKLGPKAIDKPGPGELLVKIEAAALNPVGPVLALCSGCCFSCHHDSRIGSTRRIRSQSSPCASRASFRGVRVTVRPQTYPLVLGSDSAGVVEEVGEGVSGWSKGDRM
jgi:NADPH:quinone reductase-like Zn-dependent oxidoreductase